MLLLLLPAPPPPGQGPLLKRPSRAAAVVHATGVGSTTGRKPDAADTFPAKKGSKTIERPASRADLVMHIVILPPVLLCPTMYIVETSVHLNSRHDLPSYLQGARTTPVVGTLSQHGPVTEPPPLPAPGPSKEADRSADLTSHCTYSSESRSRSMGKTLLG